MRACFLCGEVFFVVIMVTDNFGILENVVTHDDTQQLFLYIIFAEVYSSFFSTYEQLHVC